MTQPLEVGQFSKVTTVAVAVCRNGDGDRKHAGILHRDRAQLRLLELQGHKRLRNDPVRQDYLWVQPAIEPERAKLIAARCRRVFKRFGESGLYYGFRYATARFGENDDFVPSGGEQGLTCATLVLAVFASENVVFLDPTTWPAADSEDKAWQSHMLHRGVDAILITRRGERRHEAPAERAA